MMPDLPMPVTITRPRQLRRSWTAASNLASTRATSARIAAASVWSTFRARARSAIDLHLGLLHDAIDRHQSMEQRLESIESQRGLRVAFCRRRVLVHLEKDAVDASGHPRRGERFDVLRKAGRDP